ncbi:MAG: MFS transporter [Candidatus Binataceae bacterium]
MIEASPSSPASPEQAESAPGSVYGGQFWLLFGATFMLNLVMNLLVLYPLFIVKLGGGASVIGAIIGTGSLAALLSRPATSAAIGWRGRRWTAWWGLVVNAIEMLWLIPLRAIGWSIYAATALAGVANGTARVALFAMLYDILPAGRQGETMSIFSLSGMIPATFAALVGELILQRSGFTAFFITAAVMSAIAGGIVLMLPDDHPRNVSAQVGGNVREFASYASLLADRALLMLWLLTLAFGLVLASRNSFVAPFGVAEGIANVGWYFTIYSAVATVVRLNGGLMDRIGLERILVPSMIVNGVGIAMVAFTGHYWMLYIAAAIGGLGHGFVYPALSALVIRHTPPREMGRASTVYTSIWDLSAMAGPYLFGITAEFAGYAPMFLIAGALAIASAIFSGTSGLVKPNTRRHEVGPS